MTGKAQNRDGRRVVVTGLGVVSPVGNDVESTWANILAGTSGADTIRAFEATADFATRIACEVKGFDPTLYMDRKDARRFDRVLQFALDSPFEGPGAVICIITHLGQVGARLRADDQPIATIR